MNVLLLALQEGVVFFYTIYWWNLFILFDPINEVLLNLHNRNSHLLIEGRPLQYIYTISIYHNNTQIQIENPLSITNPNIRKKF